MSLVLDALRRVEKPDARTGSVGVAVASYRPLRRPRRSWAPLLLGLIVGGVAVLLFGPGGGSLGTSDALPAASASNGPPARALGGAGLPPPLILDTAEAAVGPKGSEASQPPSPQRSPTSIRPDRAAPVEPVAAVFRGFVLQAISERDSHAIAVISDQLVKEGDLIGKARVVKIGADTVEVLHEGGRRELIRFQAPPDPTPTPDGR